MPTAIRLDLYRLLLAVSEALDLISPALVNHHKQVSHLAFHLGKRMGLSGQELMDLTMAGALHDIGGLSRSSRLAALQFDMANPESHTIPGSLLLARFRPFATVAQLTRFHHQPWADGAGGEHKGEAIPHGAHILHLADRVAVLIRPEREILAQAEEILATIEERSGSIFLPAAVEALREVAASEAFWFDVTSSHVCEAVTAENPEPLVTISAEDMEGLARMFHQIIDFRSRFTVTHSSGVAAVSRWLAAKAGFDTESCGQMAIAGFLHDIGKLAVPQEVLEKNTPLTREDFYAIRKHPYYTQRILGQIPGFERISEWGGYHHERLDGSGYPFHLAGTQLSTGARLMALADTFTALTETRPYRSAMSGRGTLRAMEAMVAANKLDNDLYALLRDNFAEADGMREQAQHDSFEEHRAFLAQWTGLAAEASTA